MEAIIGLTGFIGLIISSICSIIGKVKGKPTRQTLAFPFFFAVLFLCAICGFPIIGLILAVIIWTLIYYPFFNKDTKMASISSDVFDQSQMKFKKMSNKQKVERIIYLNNLVQEKIETLQNANFASQFVNSFELLQAAVNEIASFSGNVRLQDTSLDLFAPKRKLEEIKKDCQWYLRNTIERQKNNTLSRLPQYKNSKEHRKKEYIDFCNDILSVAYFFSDESKEFADEAAEEIYQATDLYFPRILLFPNGYNTQYQEVPESNRTIPGLTFQNRESQVVQVSPIETELNEADLMEGHDFEYWCADLLRKNNFVNVKVTRGSKDHGADVLAEKDGITYAIQCKCYSSDLGNASVQQANAGRDIYKTHIGVVMTNSYLTTQAKEEAQAMKILLWDRDTLQSMIKTSYIRQNNGHITIDEIEFFEAMDDE